MIHPSTRRVEQLLREIGIPRRQFRVRTPVIRSGGWHPTEITLFLRPAHRIVGKHVDFLMLNGVSVHRIKGIFKEPYEDYFILKYKGYGASEYLETVLEGNAQSAFDIGDKVSELYKV